VSTKKDKFSGLLSKKNIGAEKNEAHLQSAHQSLFTEETEIKKTEEKKAESPRKKKLFEEEYSRATFYIENDLLQQIKEHAGRTKGEKTRIVNEAIQEYLNKYYG
jgi:Ribbon-helix-helix domain